MRFRLQLAVFLAIVGLFGHNSFAAKSVGKNGNSQLHSIPATPGLGKIQEKITILEKSSDGEDNSQKIALNLYRQALDNLKEAQSYKNKFAAFDGARRTAPKEIKIIQRLSARLSKQTLVEDNIKPSIPLKELEQRLALKQVERLAMQDNLSEIENTIIKEQSRPSNARAELAQVQLKLERTEVLLKDQLPADPPSTLKEAQRTERETFRYRAYFQIQMLRQELLSHDIRFKLLTGQRDITGQQLSAAESNVKHLQDIIDQRRGILAEQVRLETDIAKGEASGKHLLIRNASENNAELGQRLTKLTADIKRSAQTRDGISKQLKQLEQRFRFTKRQLEFAGRSEVLGEVLRGERKHLPNIRTYQRKIRKLQNEIAQARLDQFQIDEQRRGLGDVNQRVDRDLNTFADGTLSKRERKELRPELNRLLLERKKLLVTIGDANNRYLQELSGLDSEQKQFIDIAERFSELLDKRLLWVRSAPPVGLGWFGDLSKSFGWFISVGTWTDVVKTLFQEAVGNFPLTILVLTASAALIGIRRRLSLRLDISAQNVGKVQKDKVLYTFEALGIVILFSIPWALLMAYSGWLLESSPELKELPQAVGRGLILAATTFFFLSTFRWVVKNRGVADSHFRWNKHMRQVAWRNLQWFRIIAVPLVLVNQITELQTYELHRDSLGRLAFIMFCVAMSVFAWRIMRAHRQTITASTTSKPSGWLWSVRFVIYPIAVAMPLGLIVLSMIGYYYTALQLVNPLFITLAGVFETFLIYNLLSRWLLVAHRRLTMARARAKREEILAARAADKETVEAPGEAIPEVLDLPEITLQSISEQSRVLIQLTTSLTLLFALWWAWIDFLPALAILEDITLWSYQGTLDGIEQIVPITLKHIALAIVVIILTVIATRNLPGLFEVTLLSKLSPKAGTRYAVTKLGSYIIVVTGIIFAMNLLGIGWSQIQWLVAALGIGLGFGLQEIFSNFVSGLVILVEQPIRVGDTVTVGEVSGTVSKIRIRATTIVDWDNKELIVPNKSFITGEVINWTLTGSVTRLVIKVGIAYGSPTELAHKVLMDIAKSNPLVLDEPAPAVFFLGFGDSALDFELRVFVKERLQRLPLTNDLHMAIDRAFREHNIEIAFPQIDVHMHSLNSPAP